MRGRWIGIWLGLLMGPGACGDSAPPVVYPQYRPDMSLEGWCRLNAGVFAFETYPRLSPPLFDACPRCTASR